MAAPVGPSTVYPNQTVFYVADSAGMWTVTGGTIISGQGTDLIVVMWGSVVGSYSVFCTGDIDTLEISLIAGTPALITPNVAYACIEAAPTYSITSGTSITWQIMGGTIAGSDSGTSVNVTWTSLGEGIIQVFFNDGSETSGSMIVNVQPVPTPMVSGPTTVVAGSTTTYSTPDVGGDSYSWSAMGGSGSSSTNTVSILWGGTTGPGSVHVLETNLGGCSGSNTLDVTIISSSLTPLSQIFVNLHPTDEQAAVTEALNVDNLQDFAAQSVSTVANALSDLSPTGSFFPFYSTDMVSKAGAGECINSNTSWETFFNSFKPSMQSGVQFLVYSLQSDGIITTDISSLASLSSSTLASQIKSYGCTHPYMQAQASTLLSEAAQTINNYTYTFQFKGQLNYTGNQSLAGYTVTQYDGPPSSMLGSGSPNVINSTSTDANGMFTLPFNIVNDGTPTSSTSLYVAVSNETNPNILSQTFTFDTPAPIGSFTAAAPEITQTATFTPPTTTVPSASFANTTDYIYIHAALGSAPALVTFLSDNHFYVLSDILEKGGLTYATGIPTDSYSQTSIALLESFARFEQYTNQVGISNGSQVGNQLLTNGFTNSVVLANSARQNVVSSISETSGGGTGDPNAAIIHEVAKSENSFINSVSIGVLMNQALPVTRSYSSLSTSTSNIYTPGCNCSDCQSAVSPLAYLVDLFNFINNTVTRTESLDVNPIDMTFLTEHFYQPFNDLVGDCDQVNETVCQMRLAVEVMRNYYLANTPSNPDALNAAVAVYCTDIYNALLQQLGTTYEQIRTIQNASAVNKANLAGTLGIYYSAASNPFDSIPFDPFPQLYLNPNISQVTEPNLEILFGLVDSTRNPLSDGQVGQDTYTQIQRWNLNGVNWNQNTDIDGKIYLSLTRTFDSPTYTFTVNLYSDSLASKLVASGQATSTSSTFDGGKVVLKEPARTGTGPYTYFNSGLSGIIQIKTYDGGISTEAMVVLYAIPLFTCWRLRQIRYQWFNEEYFINSQQNLIIDPDLLNQADFFNPYLSGTEDPTTIFGDRQTQVANFLSVVQNSANAVAVTLPTGSSPGSFVVDSNRNLIYIDIGSDGSYVTPDIKYIPYTYPLYSSSGGYISTPAELIPYNSSFPNPGHVNSPSALYIDANNNLFILEHSLDIIHQYTLSCSYSSGIPSLTATFVRLLNDYEPGGGALPVAISTDNDKTLYIQFNHNPFNTIDLPDILNNSGFGSLKNLITDKNGFVYVVDSANNVVYKLNPFPNPNGIFTNGLISYLPCNTYSSGSTPDLSSFGYSGNTTGTVTQITGIKDNALYFNGSSYLSIGSASPINTCASLRTIELWFNVTDITVSANKQILFYQGDTTNGIVAYIFSSVLYVGIYSANGMSTFIWTDNIFSQYWHQLVIVLDANSSILSANALKCYIDGILFGSGNALPLPTTSNGIILAAAGGRSVRFFDGNSSATNGLVGAIENFRVWNWVFTDNEITELFQTTYYSSGMVSEAIIGSNFTNDLLAFYPFDEIVSGQTPDDSQYGLLANIVDTGSTAPVTQPGILNNCIFFASTSTNSYISIPDTTHINNGKNQQTLEIWFSVLDITVSTRKQVIYYQGDTSNGIIAYTYNSLLYIGFYSTGSPAYTTFISSNQIASSKWQQLVIVIDSDPNNPLNNTFQGYLNGNLFGTGNGRAVVSTSSDIVSMATCGGKNARFHDYNGTFDSNPNQFCGSIEMFRVWSRAFEDSEVENLFQTLLTGNGVLNSPNGIAIDSSGNVYVSDTGNAQIQVFDSSSNFIQKFGTSGSGPGQFTHPLGIAIDSNDILYVTDNNGSTGLVQKFSLSGGYIATFGNAGTGALYNPTGVAFDSSGTIYVSDNNSSNGVMSYDSAGNLITAYSGFSNSQSIAIDQNNNICVVESGTSGANVINVINTSGTAVADWRNVEWQDSLGHTPWAVTNSRGIAIDNNSNIYVSDSPGSGNPDRILRTKIPMSLPSPIAFESNYLAANPDGSFFASYSSENVVYKMDIEGNIVTSFGPNGNGTLSITNPKGLAVDISGNLYVASNATSASSVQKFDPTGRFLAQWPPTGGAPEILTNIAVDHWGKAYALSGSAIEVYDTGYGFGEVLARAINGIIGIGSNETSGTFSIIGNYSFNDFWQLTIDESFGNDITNDLNNLRLNIQNYRYLANSLLVIENGYNLETDTWTDVYDLLIFSWKTSFFNLWRSDPNYNYSEYDLKLVLSPDYFVLQPSNLESDLILSNYRVSSNQRSIWVDTLQTRTDEQTNVFIEMGSAVSAAEESTLSELRDALVNAFVLTGYPTLDMKAKYLTEMLLIDMANNCCSPTTRVSQAIDTLQGFLVAVRNGFLTNFYSEITLDISQDYFDEEIVWMGSYAAWRAAMFVFMYPENLLLPSLNNIQSPLFQTITSELQGDTSFTPADAEQVAQQYSAYYSDVCNLTLKASCLVNATDPNYNGKLNVLYVFALAPSKQVYWQMLTENNGATYDLNPGFWDVVPGTANATDILGAVPYNLGNPGSEYIFLYFTVNGQNGTQLNQIKYDTLQGTWDQQTTVIGIPGLFPPASDLTNIQVVVMQSIYDFRPPYFGILNAGGLFNDILKDDGSNIYSSWPFSPVLQDNSGIIALYDYMDLHKNPEGHAIIFVSGSGSSGELQVQFIPDTASNISTEPIDTKVSVADTSNFTFIGAFNWPSTSLIYIFYKNGTNDPQCVLIDLTGTIAPTTFEADSSLIKWIRPSSPGVSDTSPQYIYMFAEYLPSNPTVSASGTRQMVYLPVRQNSDNSLEYSASFVTRIRPEDPSGNISLPSNSPNNRQALSQTIETVYNNNTGVKPNVLAYLDEAYYFVPVSLALQLQQSGFFTEALSWFKQVFDYTTIVSQRKIAYKLVLEESTSNIATRASNWVEDPINPHAIAATRQNAYTKFTVQSIVTCLLAYADSLFTSDTVETVNQARQFYMAAIDLLESEGLSLYNTPCQQSIASINVLVPASLDNLWLELQSLLSEINDPTALNTIISGIPTPPTELALSDLEALRYSIYQQIDSQQDTDLVATKAEFAEEFYSSAGTAMYSDPNIFTAAVSVNTVAAAATLNVISQTTGIDKTTLSNTSTSLSFLQAAPANNYNYGAPISGMSSSYASSSFVTEIGFNPAAATPRQIATQSALANPNQHNASLKNNQVFYTPIVNFDFCIPSNPIVYNFRLYAAVNLYKIRNCMNISGTVRELDPFAAPTNSTSGIPTIGAGGTITLPNANTYTPSQYHYSTLIARAKQLVATAQQMEALLLSALANEDAENYSAQQAQQNLNTSLATVTVQQLQVQTAQDGVTVVQAQNKKVQDQINYYSSLLTSPINLLEQAALLALSGSALFQGYAAITGAVAATANFAEGQIGAGVSSIAGTFSSIASSLSTLSQLSQMQASYDLQVSGWQFQLGQSQDDQQIGNDQLAVANDQVSVAAQQLVVSQTQATNAQDSLNFLLNKFTNASLYAWMVNILQGTYKFFLQQATSMAQVAAQQLSFEQHQDLTNLIQNDYWDPPQTNQITTGSTTSATPANMEGLTGAERLLADITNLDDQAFNDNVPKLQMNKTISLAQYAPMDFQNFISTGSITFSIPMSVFDRDFPGQYLRLIRRIRISVLALVSPVDSIKATLTSFGSSSAVVSGNTFQTVTIVKPSQTIAYTSTTLATGLFELDSQTDVLLPFEDLGVDSSFEFRMEKASNFFDFTTIADVQISIDYAALFSANYRAQVIKTIDNSISKDRYYSFVNNIPDQWYSILNTAPNTDAIVTFSTAAQDFPVNVNNIAIQNLQMYFVPAGNAVDIDVNSFTFTPNGNTAISLGDTASLNGLISTRNGNGANWLPAIGNPPFGTWSFVIDSSDLAPFLNQQIVDIFFVITFTGQAPAFLP